MSARSTRLAIDGGPKTRTSPWPIRKLYGPEEKGAVDALFDRAMVEGHQVLGYNGPQEDAYCREFAEFQGGGFADGVNSGTNAVYVALRALDLPPGSEVIVPPISDPGGIMPVVACDCIPVPADSDPMSYNTSVTRIRKRLTPRTRAIVVAHISGIPVDMDPILKLADSRGLPVVEDCAQAHGALYKGRRVGALGTIAAFSTMFGKHHTTGGQGGLVFTRDEALYGRIRRCADRGKPFGIQGQARNVLCALNCNMDELHAAIGREQLKKLPSIIARRRKVALAIARGLEGKSRAFRLKTDPPGCEAVFWFLLFQVDFAKLAVDKAKLVAALNAEGVSFGPGYLHVPGTYPWYQDLSEGEGAAQRRAAGMPALPPASSYPLPIIHATDAVHLMLGIHEDWTTAESADVVKAVVKVEKAYAHV
jgi:perosamine synthetase